MATVTRLPCATYRTDIPASLRTHAGDGLHHVEVWPPERHGAEVRPPALPAGIAHPSLAG
ncbi:hypothetical protein GCM10008997_38640 [Halomonas salifodinae]